MEKDVVGRPVDDVGCSISIVKERDDGGKSLPSTLCKDRLRVRAAVPAGAE